MFSVRTAIASGPVRDIRLIKPGSRQYVHLSPDRETAVNVGSRHGVPDVYVIRAREMYQAGLRFYGSENKVWLTEYVPLAYLVYDNE